MADLAPNRAAQADSYPQREATRNAALQHVGEAPRAVVGAVPRARRTDPETSHAAAANADLFAGKHADRILAALREMGTGTAHEIAVATGLSVVQVDRRRKEMETAGLITVLRQGGKLFTRDGFMVWAPVEVSQ
jgi:predicted transcriptional regulator